ncbi:DUF1700 domain-containing protein [Longirhabdus pacifica]|uniref:DUF1700 domain-containing protein n=1 Tax=Longirhabdus pacifica TaxID=2305227 RepID=UPI001008C221|nr:DUF1700 domain-containing protein [Longirhabdus pacifica]
MNRQLYAAQLRALLKEIPLKAQQPFFEDLAEFFDKGLRMGRTEEQSIALLGDPLHIANDFIAEYYVNNPQEPEPAPKNGSPILSVIGISFLNLLLIAPFIAGFFIFIAFFILAGVFVLTPLLTVGDVILDLYFFSLTFNNIHWLEIFLSVFLCGLGILLFPLVMKFGRKLIKWVAAYMKLNLRIAKSLIK